jgi:hypothetical protein
VLQSGKTKHGCHGSTKKLFNCAPLGWLDIIFYPGLLATVVVCGGTTVNFPDIYYHVKPADNIYPANTDSVLGKFQHTQTRRYNKKPRKYVFSVRAPATFNISIFSFLNEELHMNGLCKAAIIALVLATVAAFTLPASAAFAATSSGSFSATSSSFGSFSSFGGFGGLGGFAGTGLFGPFGGFGGLGLGRFGGLGLGLGRFGGFAGAFSPFWGGLGGCGLGGCGLGGLGGCLLALGGCGIC